MKRRKKQKQTKAKRCVIVATGGHLTAAVAVIEELRSKGGWEVYWMGTGEAFETAPFVPSFESQLLPQMNIPLIKIKTGKLQRGRVKETTLSLLKIPVGLAQSFFALLRIRPNVLLSFGGYVSIPVSIAAFLLDIPIIVHEQTASSGLANRVVGRFAKFVAISNEKSAKDFPEEKTVLTGNPVRRAISKIARNRPSGAKEHVFYVTGGSRGSQLINNGIFKNLPRLAGKARIYHQTGVFDFDKAKEKKKTLGKNAKRYIPAVSFTLSEVEEIYKKATLVISRSGANTVSELEVLGIPAILIPIPWVEKEEQEENAHLLKEFGTAEVIKQDQLSPGRLLKVIDKVLTNYNQYRPKTKPNLSNPQAALKIVDLIKRAEE